MADQKRFEVGTTRRGFFAPPILDRGQEFVWAAGANNARAIVDLLNELQDELDRRDRFDGCDGCSTGDCPHSTVQECSDAQAAIIREQAAEIDRLHEVIAGLKGLDILNDSIIAQRNRDDAEFERHRQAAHARAASRAARDVEISEGSDA